MSGQIPNADNQRQINPKRPLDQEIRSVLERLEGQSLRNDNPDPILEKSWGTEMILGEGDKKLNLSVLHDRRTPGMLLSIWHIHEDETPQLEWVKLLEAEDVEICLLASVAAINYIVSPPRINRPRPVQQGLKDSECFAQDASGYFSLSSEFEEGGLALKLKAHRQWKKPPEDIATIPYECLYSFIHSLQLGWYDILEESEIGDAK